MIRGYGALMPWSKENLPDSVKNKDWSDHQKETFVKTANAVLAETGDDGEAIATGIKQAESAAEKKNANQFPRFFYARHMQPGLAQYLTETILVDTAACKRMCATGRGKPVYIGHQNVDLKNIKQEANGYITDSFYNELDGWLWFEFMAIDDAMYQRIANGDSVSNAYIPTEWGPRGTKNNCAYDREIVNADFTHLAIVPDPRYEGAKIFTPDEFKTYQEMMRRELLELQNANDESAKGNKPMFKFLKTKREEVQNPDAETQVEFKNEKGDVLNPTVKELIEVYNAKKNADDEAAAKKKAEEDEEKKEKMNEDTEIDVGDGTMVPLKEMMNVYCDMMKSKGSEMKNSAEKEAADKAAADKKAAEDKAALEVKNANEKKAEELRNANRNPKTTTIDTSLDKVERGKQRYGSSK